MTVDHGGESLGVGPEEPDLSGRDLQLNPAALGFNRTEIAGFGLGSLAPDQAALYQDPHRTTPVFGEVVVNRFTDTTEDQPTH